jgi:hypothetical protein
VFRNLITCATVLTKGLLAIEGGGGAALSLKAAAAVEKRAERGAVDTPVTPARCRERLANRANIVTARLNNALTALRNYVFFTLRLISTYRVEINWRLNGL